MQLLGVAAVGCTVTSAAAAQAPSAVELRSVSPARTGWIGLDVSGPPGSSITLSERVNGVPKPFRTVALSRAEMTLSRALAWRCDRRVRRLQADATDPSGARSTATLTVSTPS